MVADAGMLSAANLLALEEAGFRFIVGSKISKAPYDLADHLERHGNAFDDGQTIETTRTMGTGKATSPTSTPTPSPARRSWPPTTTSTRSNAPSGWPSPTSPPARSSTGCATASKPTSRSCSPRSRSPVKHRPGTGQSINKIVKTLRPLRTATIALAGQQIQVPPRVPDDAQRLLNDLRGGH